MKAERIFSTPIHECCDTMLNRDYLILFQRYLVHECGCTCTVLDDNSVLVRFPKGTMEEEYAGKSTRWKRETTISLPNGIQLCKRVYPPPEEGGKMLVALLLPEGIIEKAEKRGNV